MPRDKKARKYCKLQNNINECILTALQGFVATELERQKREKALGKQVQVLLSKVAELEHRLTASRPCEFDGCGYPVFPARTDRHAAQCKRCGEWTEFLQREARG